MIGERAMTEKTVGLEEVEVALGVLLWIERIYVKVTVVAALVSVPFAVVSYLLQIRTVALFFVYFGTAVTWISEPIIVNMLVTEMWLVVKRARLRGNFTRLDVAVIATNIIYAVILSLFFFALTMKIVSLTPAGRRVE